MVHLKLLGREKYFLVSKEWWTGCGGIEGWEIVAEHEDEAVLEAMIKLTEEANNVR
jgi:hypothetical protein